MHELERSYQWTWSVSYADTILCAQAFLSVSESTFEIPVQNVEYLRGIKY